MKYGIARCKLKTDDRWNEFLSADTEALHSGSGTGKNPKIKINDLTSSYYKIYNT